MSYKTILVYFRDEMEAPEIAATACRLAEQHDAHVIGLNVAPNTLVLPVTGFPVPQPLIDKSSEQQAQRAKAINAILDKQASKSSQSWEWRHLVSEGTTVSRIVADHAQCTDLIVIGQPAKGTSYIEPDMTFETLLMDSGRPVLVVPSAATPRATCKHVMIAWNGTREAARAAFDAVPLMVAAGTEKVTLVRIESRTGLNGGETTDRELVASLARHGLKVDLAHEPRQGGAGETLLAQASKLGADLLVMGCYGHSRVREFVFGGATDHILRHMETPVLMAR